MQEYKSSLSERQQHQRVKNHPHDLRGMQVFSADGSTERAGEREGTHDSFVNKTKGQCERQHNAAFQVLVKSLVMEAVCVFVCNQVSGYR